MKVRLFLLQRNVLVLVCLLSALIVSLSACSDGLQPPYIKAQVIDVYNSKTIIYDARFYYWWQERGDTAFLDTYDTIRHELMLSVISRGNQANSSLVSERIHLQDVQRIEWVLAETGKKMFVYRRDRPVIETKCLFPQELRVNSNAGLADYTCFIAGSLSKDSKAFDFKQDLNFLKSITVISVEEGR